jgi:HAD superfamily hydrolase (TIGR01490 family)
VRYAFFDLDHTLLPFDTQTLFCNFVLKRQPWRVALHLLFLPFALGRAVGIVSTSAAKRAFLSYLWGMRRSRLRELARDFAHDCVHTWLYPELQAEILRHKHQGRILVLNTASPHFYAEAIAELLEFDHCVATQVNLPGARVPLRPGLIGPNNKREAKIAAMNKQVPGVARLTEEQRFHCWAYTDSMADLPLLKFAGNRVLVHPTAILRNQFPGHGATILRPARPYCCRPAGFFRALLQVIGLHPVRGPNG